jgi:hypothetical protein
MVYGPRDTLLDIDFVAAPRPSILPLRRAPEPEGTPFVF